ncbi:MAG: thioredoxin fold domain-containing protein [Geminicoccales bacterium]
MTRPISKALIIILKDQIMISGLRCKLSAMLFGLVVLIVQTAPAQTAELVMFESEICEWCDAWHAEIGPIYPRTDEGKRAPLRMVDIHDTRPDDLADVEGIRFTPTFVLLSDDGQEVGRINGYPGEDFFWGLLGELIDKLNTDPGPAIGAEA